jgi:hypothetical protein
MVASITWMEQLSPSLVFHLRTFGYWLANGTVGHPVLNGVDYADRLRRHPLELII